MYNSIKEYNTNLYNIARNLNFKAENIKNVKDYKFYGKYKFDQYSYLGKQTESKQFDPNLQQTLA